MIVESKINAKVTIVGWFRIRVKRDILLHLHVSVQIFVSVNVLSALWSRLEDTIVKVRKIDQT